MEPPRVHADWSQVQRWPDLDLPDFASTMDTLHLWAQIAGKVKLAALPWLNESWHVPLYLSGAGFTTGLVTADEVGFDLQFDFQAGEFRLTASNGGGRIALGPTSVAHFYADVLALLASAGIKLTLPTRPSEIAGALPFADDTAERVFDVSAARAWWQALIQAQRQFHRFRSRFTGKCSPIHLFWGSFDLTVTRFSGRPAPLVTRGGPNLSVAVAQAAYADEQCGCGFWPGGNGADGPTFYLEAWPEPDGLERAAIGPAGARFDNALGKWLLDYGTVRDADDPDAALMTFLETGYAAVADLGGWPRAQLERPEGPVGHPPPLGRRAG